MSIESKLSGHWTDEELIGSLYGVGPEGSHLTECVECQVKLAEMQTQRQKLEVAAEPEVSFEFLAAQRRAVYQRLEQPVRWWSAQYMRRLAAGLATALVLSGSVYVYEQNRQVEMAKERVSDAQLLQEVTAMASTDSGAASVEPIEGLFEQ